MYDRPETAAANDALWAEMRAALGFGPARLDRVTPEWEVWQSPDLLVSQTCGLPYRTRLHGRVRLVGTPDYRLEGAPPGHYYSVFVTRRGDSTELTDYRTRTLAFNDRLSQSGWAAAQDHARRLGFRFDALLDTGSHRASARAVASGEADIASLDAVSWRLIRRFDAFSSELQVIATTRPTPGLPLITSAGMDADALFDAFAQAVENLGSARRETLGLCGIVAIPAADYLSVPLPPTG